LQQFLFENSNKLNFSNVFFSLTAGKIGNFKAHQRIVVHTKKTVEVLIKT
jgi:hypothetical protein